MKHHVHRYFVPDSLQNYNHLVVAGDKAASIDPFNWDLALAEAERLGVTLTEIWLTHGHGDHVAGVPKHFAGPVRGHPDTASRVNLTDPLTGGEKLAFNGCPVEVLATPGHTFDHLCFFLPRIPALIAGDTLFNAGVGNTRSGDTDTLFCSIQALRQLPGDTHLYNGHDYMPTNVRFTESIIGETATTQAWAEACTTTDESTRPVTTLAQEAELNLFLRTDDANLIKALELPDDAPEQQVFRKLRERRDQW
ncbi:MAG: hypothetical protein LAT62_01900 [Natronospirillum sp.]|uniref:hydroxyacylglutathione hydrolase n=1 Tax=Natronospirillum sp. TaxID=2812955 RepID=UPI0025D7DF33|nr:hydroxyacylglutathione hydrolase [Natronospirillum sp.]MCH8550658.1 hypothetical protein [Natronospirillum sp.]